MKEGERSVTAYTGRSPNDTLSDLTANLPAGQVWIRINGLASPYAALYQSPDTLLPNTAVKIVFDIEADKWVITSINPSAVIYNNGGDVAPTFAVQDHDHVTAGGPLGENTVDSGQIVAGAVGATEIADNAVNNAKLDTNAVDTANILDDAVTPTKTDGLTGSSAEIVAQTASNTFTSIPYTLSANTRLYYDGSELRPAYTYYENTTGALATSSTTELTIFTTPDLASSIDVTNSTILFLAQMTVVEQSDATSRYIFYWKYNYDNSGSEAWENVDPTNTPVGLTRFSAWQVNRDTPVSFIVPFDSSLTGGGGYSAWGYSGTYKLRLSVARQTGTGTLAIFRPIDFNRSFTILET